MWMIVLLFWHKLVAFFSIEHRETVDVMSIHAANGKKIFLDYAFIANSELDQCRKSKDDMHDDIANKQDKNPKIVTNAHNLLINYHQPRNKNRMSVM